MAASLGTLTGILTAELDSSRSKLALAARRIVFRRMDGTMSVTQRDQAIQDFQQRADVNVLIVSLKAAALGLNLVAANHVVLLDLVRISASTQLCCEMSGRDPQGLHCKFGAVPGCLLLQAACMHVTLLFMLSGKSVSLSRGVCTGAAGRGEASSPACASCGQCVLPLLHSCGRCMCTAAAP